MVTVGNTTDKVLIPSANSQKLLVDFCRRMLTEHKKFNNYHAKMASVDVAYARYQAIQKDVNGVIVNGGGVDAATTPVGVVGMKPTTPPVVVSQVDAMVGYLADVFLSGVPLFPVVSNPNNVQQAEDLETILDNHASLGGYVRQLLLFLKDGVKYNFSALEVLWTSIDQYSVTDEILSPGTKKVEKSSQKYSKVKRLDPYNVVWDHNVAPGDVSSDGDYAGYIEILSRVKTKRKLTRMGIDNECFNIKEAMGTTLNAPPAEAIYNYVQAPQVSDYVQSRKPLDGMNWIAYLTGRDSTSINQNVTGNYEIFTVYARILPIDFFLNVPEPNTTQIWRLTMVNNQVLVEARRIISAYDNLPVLCGQPLEDGLGFQTQSVAEGAIPFQTAAATMLNIRFNAARRAVSDRALYDSTVVSADDINAPVPAAKIAVRLNSLGNKTLADAYHQIPFDGRGTETALQDGLLIAGFAKDMAGLNNVQQGKFQPGNKSVTEFQTTINNSDNILRMPALILEYQVFAPLKAILKLNLFQYGSDAIVVSQKDGAVRDVNMAVLRQQVLAFRIADGFTPKSKLASTDAISQLLQMILSSQIAAQQFGPMLPGIVIHLAQLQGIRGLEQYLPQQPAQQPQPGGAAPVQGPVQGQPAPQPQQAPTQ